MESGNIIARNVIRTNLKQIENRNLQRRPREGKRVLSIVLSIILENQNGISLNANRPEQVEVDFVLEDTDGKKEIATMSSSETCSKFSKGKEGKKTYGHE